MRQRDDSPCSSPRPAVGELGFGLPTCTTLDLFHLQWDGDTANAQHILDELPTYYPGATKYEVAGFFWWQGDKDSRDMGLSSHRRWSHSDAM